MTRIMALVIMLIPGFLAALGIKWMRDVLFGLLQDPFPYLWLQFLVGFLFFIIGLGFVAGFIFYRDRKRNKVQPKFQRNQKKPNKD
ncbi:DUF2627 domain-containing protein [Bacillus sp. 2205SS5-2]|uniref:DUF2627 domain-containing protein n=1 Tax=Bacillus sp. 2205SS5-2 TaxID=3109031 RepID=UPI003003DC1B